MSGRESIMAVIGEGGRTHQLAKRAGCSTTKARYYLRHLEAAGRVCRDDRYTADNDIYWRPVALAKHQPEIEGE